MSSIVVSIIIPVYKVEKYIHRCVNSVLNQTYKNLEIILVNDGSPDNCPAICDDYAKKDLRIKVIHKKNGGSSEARNFGLDICTGQYLSFIDSDDFIAYNFIEDLLNLCLQHDCDISQCLYEKGKNEYFPFYNKKENINIYDNQQIFDERRLIIGPWAKLYNSSLFADIRFPVGRIYEDDFTIWKLVYKANRIAVTNKKLYYFYQSPGSIMRNKSDFIRVDFYEAYNERLYFFKSRNKTFLYEKSKELYCLTLMLIYFECKKNKNNTNDTGEMFQIYKQHYKDIMHVKSVKLRYKFMFMLFRLFPNLLAGTVNLLKFRG